MQQARQWFLIAFMLIIIATPLACNNYNDNSANGRSSEKRSLVVYVSADDFLARQIIRAFEDKADIDVEMVGDSEINKTTGLANRIRAERDKPVADVFWSSECFMMIQLAEEDLLSPVQPELPDNWPAHLIGDNQLWHGFAPRARVIVYAPDRLAKADLPKRWFDLADSAWKDRIVMADPRFGTTRGHIGAMQHWWDEHHEAGKFDDFVDGLQANNTRLLTTGNAGVVDAVARGEADVGMTDTDDVWAAQRNGINVELIYPAHGSTNTPGEGTLVIPNTIAMINGAGNVDAAREFINFMLSEEVERIFVESDSHNIPLRETVIADHPQYAVEQPLAIDLTEAADAMDDAVDKVMGALGE